MNPPSVARANVHLNQGGVYFFKAPISVTAQLNHELIVVFSVPSIESCGLVLLESDIPQRAVEGMFDSLLKKIHEEMKVPVERIRLKAFGQSFRKRRSVRYLESWSISNRIPIVAMDVGRSVTRNVFVECATGKVGVSYAEGFTQDDPAFLTLGSVRLRETVPTHSEEIMILTTNRVQRTLVKQAIEEIVGYRANCAKSPLQIIAMNDFRDFFASRVFLFEDLEHPELISNWVANASKFYPNLIFTWFGSDPPKFQLPPGSSTLRVPRPDRLSDFKKSLSELLPKRAPVQGRVLPFQRR